MKVRNCATFEKWTGGISSYKSRRCHQWWELYRSPRNPRTILYTTQITIKFDNLGFQATHWYAQTNSYCMIRCTAHRNSRAYCGKNVVGGCAQKKRLERGKSNWLKSRRSQCAEQARSQNTRLWDKSSETVGNSNRSACGIRSYYYRIYLRSLVNPPEPASDLAKLEWIA